MKASREDLRQISRLPNQAAYDSIRKSQTRWVSETFVVQAQAKASGKKPRPKAYGLCVTVSKKAASKAHDRVRIRRRLKAVASEILPHKAKPDMDYTLVARGKALEEDFETLRKNLIWCLKRLELLR